MTKPLDLGDLSTIGPVWTIELQEMPSVGDFQALDRAPCKMFENGSRHPFHHASLLDCVKCIDNELRKRGVVWRLRFPNGALFLCRARSIAELNAGIPKHSMQRIAPVVDSLRATQRMEGAP